MFRAPTNDLLYIADLRAYRKHDSDIAEAVLGMMDGHTHYLG